MRTARPISIRIQLTLWYSAVLACGLILFAVAVWILLKHTLYKDLRSELTVRATSLETFITSEVKESSVHLTEELEEYSRALPDGTYFRLFDDGGVRLFSSSASFSFPPDQKFQGVDVTWKFWKQPRYLFLRNFITLQGKTYRIDGLISAREARSILEQLRILLITLTPAVLLIAAMGGLLLSRRALRPVDEITNAAAMLSIRDLSGRLPAPKTGDELQRLAETWNSMLDRLQNAVQRLTRFTQDASHELRTPLAIIRSTAEIASRRSRSEESYRKAFGQIVEESDRLTRLVEDLLLLARSDQPARPHFEDLSLPALVSEVCKEMNPLAEQKGIWLEIEQPADAVGIHGNALSLRRLLVVLLDNAIKYSPSGSAIKVRILLGEGGAALQVADRGIGILSGDMAHIFERFYRGEAAREAWSNGAGLGLSLAASIAEQHAATIAVGSQAGQGSVFTVTFPVPIAQVLSTV